jgi:predicted site-specific integrase-resolvase
MSDNDPLFTPREAADALRSNPRTLERWRTTGDGPAFVKVGRRVCYQESAIKKFIRQQTRRHTADAK